MEQARKHLLLTTLILIGFGIVIIYSSTAIPTKSDPYYFLKRHLLWLCISGIGMLCAMSIDYRKLLPLAKYLMLLAGILLVLVLLPGMGTTVYGARRWLRYGEFGFQPSEFANIAVIIFVAAYLHLRQGKLHRFFGGFLPVAVIVGCTCMLVLVEPDVGSAAVIGMVAASMLFVGGIRLSHFACVTSCTLPLIAYYAYTKFEHVRDRIHGFLNYELDPLGKGYQVMQSLIALGAGGLFGVGLGMSKQKLHFLPAGYSDFIFAIIGEELGFIGAATVVMLFTLLFISGIRIAHHAPDAFGAYLALGFSISIALRTIINIGVVTASIPTKGIPLPFISYGGSSLFFNLVAIGIMLNIAEHSQRKAPPPDTTQQPDHVHPDRTALT